ncbi:RNA-binding protein [Candidatus Gottesmanbacteria bacterium]|nr:RNA-binding protein [Candidatus Gottesmanbacteria bacterium]
MATNLFVGNLPYNMDSDKLGQVFAAAGQVVSAKVISDKYSGRSRGFGFVEMASDAESKKAIEMFNGKDVEGRAMVVNEARPREERPRQ